MGGAAGNWATVFARLLTAFVLDCLAGRAFKKTDFFETREGMSTPVES
jgi:hypothetical protein